MKLQDVLLPEFIKVDIEAQEKNKAFEEMINWFCQAEKSNAHKEILDAIQAREAKM